MKWFWELSEKPIFGLSSGLFLDTPDHEFLGYSQICVKLVDVLISFVIWYILMKNEQNRSNGSWDIDEKVIFARKMPPLWKNQNFRKMAARPILWPTMPSNFMQKIKKI